MYEIPNSSGSTELIAQAEHMISTASDAVQRGDMLIAAIEEGAAISPAEVLSNADTAAEIHIPETPDGVSADSWSRLLRQNALSAYAKTGQFAEAEEILSSFRGINTKCYLDGVCDLLKHGYAGSSDRYAHIGIEELRAMSKRHLEELNLPDNGPEQRLKSEEATQLTFMSRYLSAIGCYGVNVFEAEGERGDLLGAIKGLSERTDNPVRYQAALYDLGAEYVEAGNLGPAVSCMESLTMLVPRANLELDIVERAGGILAVPDNLRDVMALMEEIKKSAGQDGNPQNITVFEVLQLQMRLLEIEMNLQQGNDATPILNRIVSNPELHKNEDIQLDFHTKLYRQTGNGTAREISLGYLSRAHGAFAGDPAKAAAFIRTIAEADLAYNHVTPGFDGEATPMVCWELDEIFWGDKLFDAQLAGGDTSKFDRFRVLLPIEEAVEASDVYGPHSAIMGAEFAADDIQISKQRRDRSSAELVTLLAEHGISNGARQMLETIETPAEQVRARLALAKRLH